MHYDLAHRAWIHQGFKWVAENLKENRKPVGIAKAYLSG
jgi:hypothetical protein